MSNLISCAQYDYFEIACMHHYELEITLKNTKQVIGIAHNLKVVKEGHVRKEVLMVLLPCDEMMTIALIDINKIRAIKDNPHFREVRLTRV